VPARHSAIGAAIEAASALVSTTRPTISSVKPEAPGVGTKKPISEMIDRTERTSRSRAWAP